MHKSIYLTGEPKDIVFVYKTKDES